MSEDGRKISGTGDKFSLPSGSLCFQSVGSRRSGLVHFSYSQTFALPRPSKFFGSCGRCPCESTTDLESKHGEYGGMAAGHSILPFTRP